MDFFMKKIQKNNITRLMFFCIISTLIVVNFSLSKFKTTTAPTEATTRVAVMASNITADINANLKVYPGCDPIVCPIELTNNDGEKTCEVSQTFTISVEKNDLANLPITFALYKDENCTEIIEPNEDGIYISEEFKFNANARETKKYYLKASWPEEKNNESYAFEIDCFKLNINVTQVD